MDLFNTYYTYLDKFVSCLMHHLAAFKGRTWAMLCPLISAYRLSVAVQVIIFKIFQTSEKSLLMETEFELNQWSPSCLSVIEESNLLCFYWTASSVWLSVLVLGCSRCSSPQWHILDLMPLWVGLGDVANGLHPINRAALSVCDLSSHKFSHLLILGHRTMIVFSKYNKNRHVCFSLTLGCDNWELMGQRWGRGRWNVDERAR